MRRCGTFPQLSNVGGLVTTPVVAWAWKAEQAILCDFCGDEASTRLDCWGHSPGDQGHVERLYTEVSRTDSQTHGCSSSSS